MPTSKKKSSKKKQSTRSGQKTKKLTPRQKIRQKLEGLKKGDLVVTNLKGFYGLSEKSYMAVLTGKARASLQGQRLEGDFGSFVLGSNKPYHTTKKNWDKFCDNIQIEKLELTPRQAIKETTRVALTKLKAQLKAIKNKHKRLC